MENTRTVVGNDQSRLVAIKYKLTGPLQPLPAVYLDLTSIWLKLRAIRVGAAMPYGPPYSTRMPSR